MSTTKVEKMILGDVPLIEDYVNNAISYQKITGFDPNLTGGEFCVINYDAERNIETIADYGFINIPNLKENLNILAENLQPILEESSLVVVEQQHFLRLATIQGYVMGIASMHSSRPIVFSIAPMTYKTKFNLKTGNYNKNKDLVVERAGHLFPTIKNKKRLHGICDAYFMCQWGKSLIKQKYIKSNI